MDKDWLEARLAEGRSIESIAREVGKSPSTVGYWAKKYGLASAQYSAHAARFAAASSDRCPEGACRAGDVGHARSATRSAWASRASGIGSPSTDSDSDLPHYAARRAISLRRSLRDCLGTVGRDVRPCATAWLLYRAVRSAAMERVAARRRRIKEILVAEAGGRCRVGGYDVYVGALQFHHLDPATKRFGFWRHLANGVARSIARAREEAQNASRSANCHAEVEAGVTGLPCGRRRPRSA